MTGIVVAIISSGLGLVGTIITCIVSMKSVNSNVNTNIQINQAITDTKIEELTREVRSHNNFAQRMPVVEEQIKVINHRIDDAFKEINEIKKG